MTHTYNFFRQVTEVHTIKKIARTGLCILLMIGMMGSTMAVSQASWSAVDTPERSAVNYLRQCQNSDGGFPSSPGQKSSPATTAWVMMALGAAGEDLKSTAWAPHKKGPDDYLEGAKISMESLNDYSRFTLALSAMGKKAFLQGENLAEVLASSQQKNGQFALASEIEEEMINTHMWAILALNGVNGKIKNPAAAKKWLQSVQNKDGGYGWCVGTSSDPDDTAVAIQVLVILGEKTDKSQSLKKALAYLKKAKNKDGGYGLQKESNAASDAWVMQGLMAMDQQDPSLKKHLLSLQDSEGFFKWRSDTSSSPVMMTAYALTSLSGHAHPVNKTKWVKP